MFSPCTDRMKLIGAISMLTESVFNSIMKSHEFNQYKDMNQEKRKQFGSFQ